MLQDLQGCPQPSQTNLLLSFATGHPQRIGARPACSITRKPLVSNLGTTRDGWTTVMKPWAIEVGKTNPSTSTEIIALYGFYSLGLRTRRAQVWTLQIQISERHSGHSKVLSQKAWIPPEQACGRLKYAGSSSIYWSLAIPLWGSLADQGCSQSFQTSVHKKPWGVGMDVHEIQNHMFGWCLFPSWFMTPLPSPWWTVSVWD